MSTHQYRCHCGHKFSLNIAPEDEWKGVICPACRITVKEPGKDPSPFPVGTLFERSVPSEPSAQWEPIKLPKTKKPMSNGMEMFLVFLAICAVILALHLLGILPL